MTLPDGPPAGLKLGPQSPAQFEPAPNHESSYKPSNNLCPPPSQSIGPFILASASPRRRELLAAAGLSFTIEPPEVEEITFPCEPPRSCALRLAQAKARAIAQKSSHSAVLSADTVVAFESEIFGKPRDISEAFSMLSALSGRSHQVITGYCAVGVGSKEVSGVVVSDILFRFLSKEEIQAYLSLNESLDKAGAYAIQGSGGFLVDKVTGSYTNIIGLPLPEVLEALKEVSHKG